MTPVEITAQKALKIFWDSYHSCHQFRQEEREMLRRDPREDGNRGAGRYSLGDRVRLGGNWAENEAGNGKSRDIPQF